MLFDFSFINPIPICSHVASLLWKKNHVKVIHPHLLCVWLGWEMQMKRSWTSSIKHHQMLSKEISCGFLKVDKEEKQVFYLPVSKREKKKVKFTVMSQRK